MSESPYTDLICIWDKYWNIPCTILQYFSGITSSHKHRSNQQGAHHWLQASALGLHIGYRRDTLLGCSRGAGVQIVGAPQRVSARLRPQLNTNSHGKHWGQQPRCLLQQAALVQAQLTSPRPRAAHGDGLSPALGLGAGSWQRVLSVPNLLKMRPCAEIQCLPELELRKCSTSDLQAR